VESAKKEAKEVVEQDVEENNISTESKRSKRPPKTSELGDEDSSTFDHKEKLKIPDRRELAKDDHKGLAKTASEGNVLRPSSSTANLDDVIKKVDKE